MTDNKKNSQTEGSQNKTGQPNQHPQQKTNNHTQKSNDMEDDQEEKTENQKEYKDQDHQHDYKTPTGGQNRDESNQNREVGRDQSPNRGTIAGNVQNDSSERS